MKFKELQSKTEAEVRKMLEEMQSELNGLVLKIKLNQEKQTHKLKMLKKDIARVITFLHNKVK